MRDSVIGILSGLAAASIWGGMYVVSDVVLEVVPPFTLLTFRLLLAILVLAGFVVRQGIGKLSRQQFFQIAAVGAVGYGISLGFQFVGTRLSTAANGALLTAATPAFVALFGYWLLGEKLTSRRWLALVLATAGVLVVVDPRSVRLSPDVFWGNLSLLAAGLTWALYSVLVRRVILQDLALLPVTLIVLLGGLFLTLPLALVEGGVGALGLLTWELVLGVIYLGVISTALAVVLWTRAFALLEAGPASLTFFAQPVVGAGLSALFLGERLSWLFFAGGILIAAGLWLAARER